MQQSKLVRLGLTQVSPADTINLIHMGRYHNSKMRLRKAGAAETLHSSMATPVASLHLQGCPLTAVAMGVILIRGGSSVGIRNSTVFQAFQKFAASG